MKTLNFDQMERIEGGLIDCSHEMAFIGGMALAGAFGGPWGFLVGFGAGTIIAALECYDRPR